MRPERPLASFRYKMQRILRLERAIGLVWHSSRGWTIVSAGLVVIQGGLPLISLYLIKLVVDSVTVGLANPDVPDAFGQVGLFIGLAGGIALLSAACQALAGLAQEAQSQLVTDHVYGLLHAKSLEIDLAYYEDPTYYDTLHRAQREAPFRPARILQGVLRVGQSSLSVLAIVGLLLTLHWGIVVLLFLGAIPGVFVRIRYADKMYRWQRQRTLSERRASYFHMLLTGSQHAKEVRLFQLGAVFSQRFRELRQKLFTEKLALSRRRSLMELVTQASTIVIIYGAYAFIAARTLSGTMSLGDLVMYYQAMQRGQGFLQNLLAGLSGLYEDNLFLTNFYEFLALQPRVVEPLQPVHVPRPMQTGIVFEAVSFQYPHAAQRILTDLTFSIQPGEHVALVGANGAGKTTLIKLLCRLYDPSQGRILIDGIDVRQFATAALRREIGVIFQDYVHYELSARENIWLGDIAQPLETDRIPAAAREAGADAVIARLPQGYDTILGKQFEHGQELSIGEWQKVALARAFLRDSQLIVLDEPTSALDAKAEYEVFHKFHELTRGRSALLISHRLSTVRMVDRIYVMDHGRIVESGTHDDLVRRDGAYAALFETQAQYYR